MYASFGAVAPAIQQLEMARQANDGDFYTMSEIDARLRDLRAQFKREQELMRGERPAAGQGSPVADLRGRAMSLPVRKVRSGSGTPYNPGFAEPDGTRSKPSAPSPQ